MTRSCSKPIHPQLESFQVDTYPMTNPNHPTQEPLIWGKAQEVDCPRCEGAGVLQWDYDHGDGSCFQCGGAGKMLRQYGKLHRIDRVCGHCMKGNVVCIMDPGHRGRHSSVGFRCDGCGKMRRSQPLVSDPEAGDFCFICASPQVNDRGQDYWP